MQFINKCLCLRRYICVYGRKFPYDLPDLLFMSQSGTKRTNALFDTRLQNIKDFFFGKESDAINEYLVPSLSNLKFLLIRSKFL